MAVTQAEEQRSLTTTLGVMGGGVMGEAILSRLVATGLYPPQQVIVSDPQPDRQAALQQTYGVQVTGDNAVVLGQDLVLLAIKPQIFAAMVAALPPAALQSQPCVISILAGMPLARLEAALPHCPVIRAMPNTPATVGAGMTAIAPGTGVSPAQLAQARQIFATIGDVVEVPETLMDAVTGLSGSGPAYIALVIEALSDGGVAVGLPRAIAQQLALQTVRGTAELLHQKALHPALLKDQVTSPGGTTIAGVAKLEEQGLRSALIEAVRAATLRSQALGEF